MARKKSSSRGSTASGADPVLPGGFLRSVEMSWDLVRDRDEYPYSIPAVAKLGVLEFHPKVTFLVGENG